MNKKLLTFIMALMGVSIIGIVIIQMVWINNAISVKNDLFEKSIVDALSESVKEIEDLRERIIFEVNSENEEYSLNNPNSFKRENRFGGGNRDDNFRDKPYESIPNDSINTLRDRVPIDDSSIQDTIVERFKVMYQASIAKIDSLRKIADDYHIMTPEMQEQFDYQKEGYGDIRTQFLSEITTMYSSNIISIEEMQRIVKLELTGKNIPIDFDIALFRNDTIVSMSENADSLALANTIYKTRIFPRNMFDRNQSIGIFMPTQGEFIVRSVHWLLFASLIFSLIVLSTFGLSVFFMIRQKKISEMKSDFINNMTHEFKTPIATISVAADTISNSKVITQPEKISYFIEMIKKENTRMNRQVEDILAIARLDKKDFDFNWSPLNVHDTIEDVIESIILQIENRDGMITTKLKASNPTITSDKVHCANVIYNLIDNANKYSPEKPQINIETKNTTNGIIISVEDHGIGMTKSVQSKIFERFYRQTSGNIHNVKGFGLGLSYVKAVVEANKGTITVHSELGKGSRFDVFLPFTREN